VQTAIGSIVVLTTSTINRVMIVELQFLAIVPGVLVAWHYALQVLRPRWGHGSDTGGRRTPWIIGGMATLAIGGAMAAFSLPLAAASYWAGLALAAVAFTLIGIGVGAAGTSLLVMLAEQAAPDRRAAAATLVWTMMIMGFIITTITVGKLLDPFSLARLVKIACAVSGIAFVLSVIAVWGVEHERAASAAASAAPQKASFSAAIADVWQDATARHFAIFIFISMLAYSAQELIIEPFAGLMFNFTPGQSTSLAGTQHSGVLAGMILVGITATVLAKAKGSALRLWTVAGCLGSALALAGLVAAANFGAEWPLKPNVFALGFANGVYAVAAIGSMFTAAMGQKSREGVRMGLFGASQAIAFGAGGFCGTALVDILRAATHSIALSYGAVFAAGCALFVVSAYLATQIGLVRSAKPPVILPAQQQLHG
jgi:BCD family chlorophyll transporter-like MFS transporter